MQPPLKVYNSLSRKKEVFEPHNAPLVGMYVCGPTVYSDVHLGNCRTFTVVFRYLKHLGYKVRYVRNITDVGHLVDDADGGEDKIAKRAKLEDLEPMEVVQKYSNGFHRMMDRLNNLPPSIEPTATGHIMEQIEMTEALLEKGLAYEVDGSVYFDVSKYLEKHPYGELSGRKVEDLLSGTRNLDGQQDKKDAADFALWKKANPSHIMRWDSPWSIGFPGWHLECSVMSSKYLGESFDLHGGGMDLKFPHHECEIAQSKGASDKDPVKYWLHANMLTVNGSKMSKSVGNVILPDDIFTGDHQLLSQAYSPMILRFAFLQAHYRSTMDISDEALSAAGKGYRKLMNGLRTVKQLEYKVEEGTETGGKDKQMQSLIQAVYRGMNDDFNTAAAIAALFNLLKKFNAMHLGQIPMEAYSPELFEEGKATFVSMAEEVLGLEEEEPQHFEKALNFLLEDYQKAKQAKEYDQVDEIRAKFKEMGVVVKDLKHTVEWAYEE